MKNQTTEMNEKVAAKATTKTKKKSLKTQGFVEFYSEQIDIQTIDKKVKEFCKKKYKNAETVRYYVKIDEKKVYLVINEEQQEIINL